jgi:NADH dehydrogenase [ubiquinone] 1 alpha subcomplex assembly factor 7
MLPLERLIREALAAEGPMRLDRYMALCLGHPEFGYYMTREPFGEDGDFITAPEISQVFGELIGIWCAAQWQAMGKPAPFTLVELGPGRGLLLADMLRAAKVMPDFATAANIHLVETSARLREAQRQVLGDTITWHERLADVPPGPMIAVANEFFDALPIRQFEMRQGHWHERVVGLADGALVLGLVESDGFTRRGPAADRTIVEISPARTEIAAELGARLANEGGAALIIDYGHAKSAPGDTLQAMRGHGFVAVTETPGLCDLTAHVDFQALGAALAGAGAAIWPVLTQRAFLLAMGLEARSARLAAAADPQARDRLTRATRRLADETEMGNLFKVLAASHVGQGAPYPFGEP